VGGQVVDHRVDLVVAGGQVDWLLAVAAGVEGGDGGAVVLGGAGRGGFFRPLLEFSEVLVEVCDFSPLL